MPNTITSETGGNSTSGPGAALASSCNTGATSAPGMEELASFRRFKPHALMRPTLFSTADTTVVDGAGVALALADGRDVNGGGVAAAGGEILPPGGRNGNVSGVGIESGSSGTTANEGGGAGGAREVRGAGAGVGGNGVVGQEGRCEEGRLLNAWEKIEELEGLVESSRSHNERWVVRW